MNENVRMEFNEQIPQWLTNRISPFKWLNEYKYEYAFEYERHDWLPERFLGWIHLMKVLQQTTNNKQLLQQQEGENATSYNERLLQPFGRLGNRV